MPPGLLVERLRGHVEPVRPGDRSELPVDVCAGESGGIPERLEDARPLSSKRNIADRAVLEREAQLVVADHLDCRNGDKWRYLGHNCNLRRAARLAGTARPSLPPLGKEPIDSIAPAAIARWRDSLTGVSNQTKNKLCMIPSA